MKSSKEKLIQEVVEALRTRGSQNLSLPSDDFDRRIMHSLPAYVEINEENVPWLFSRIAYFVCPLSLSASALMLLYSIQLKTEIENNLEQVELVNLYLME